ncbi:ribonuclease E inhibitor RraB [Dyella halodurans]|uniref:Ribonuclease E inhibitor RraB n=1 Tax=Dyella halodurans TaxID=1920171 RepID=A0ABV9BY01_9GAMM|nr:ribonuclease E inhibitor RraB [Dyella halodurans]
MTNQAIFPDDENGAMLRQMDADGDDLSVPREIAFTVIFPTEDSALKFAVMLLKHEQKVSFAEGGDQGELFWLVQAHPYMVPSHENISSYEDLLVSEADAFGGRFIAWGCES